MLSTAIELLDAILLTEKEMSDLIATIDEMDNLSETILEENE